MIHVDEIVGLTFAEIAFILMYVIFANNFLAETSIKNEIEGLKKQKIEYEESISVLNNTLEEMNKELRSEWDPRCIDIGVATIKGNDNWLFTVKIINENLYEIDGKTLNFRHILELYGEDIKVAEQNRCRHRIKIKHNPDIDFETYLEARKPLLVLFYYQDIQ